MIPGYNLDIPSDYQLLIERLSNLFPENKDNVSRFIYEVNTVSKGLKYLTKPFIFVEILKNFSGVLNTVQYVNITLQDVFDKFKLPKEAQTLLASQWPDFLLPPEKLSFYA